MTEKDLIHPMNPPISFEAGAINHATWEAKCEATQREVIDLKLKYMLALGTIKSLKAALLTVLKEDMEARQDYD